MFYTSHMENIIERLIDMGYDRYEAENLYSFYMRNGKLDDLLDFVDEKYMSESDFE